MKNDSAEPERFGCGMHADDRLPFLEPGVRIGAFSVLGRQPYPTAANRRSINHLVGAGRIGSGTVIGCLTVIYAGVFIGREVCIGDHAVIREDVRIGSRCVIGTKVDIQYGATIADDVRILNETQIAGGTVIGEGTFIGPGVQTANDPHVAHHDLADYQDRGQVAPVIGSKVFIGVGAILLPGVRIGDGATIGAGALVSKDVPAGALVMARGVRGEVEPRILTIPGPVDADTLDRVREEFRKAHTGPNRMVAGL